MVGHALRNRFCFGENFTQDEEQAESHAKDLEEDEDPAWHHSRLSPDAVNNHIHNNERQNSEYLHGFCEDVVMIGQIGLQER